MALALRKLYKMALFVFDLLLDRILVQTYWKNIRFLIPTRTIRPQNISRIQSITDQGANYIIYELFRPINECPLVSITPPSIYISSFFNFDISLEILRKLVCEFEFLMCSEIMCQAVLWNSWILRTLSRLYFCDRFL